MIDKSLILRLAKIKGKFYTPLYMVKNILDMSGYYGRQIICKHIIDNSCGDGAFISEIVNRYCKECIKQNIDVVTLAEQLAIYIHGIEIDEQECQICVNKLNTLIKAYGIISVKWDIVCADALKTTCFDGKMDYVVGNPPYVRVHNLGRSLDEVKGFSYAQSGMTDLYIVFYEIGIRMLNKKGVLAYITPSSFYSSLAGKYMRAELVKKNLIDKLVNLKHFQAFSATTYTTIIVLRKGRDLQQLEYFEFDEKNLIPYYVDTLTPNDYYIANNFYFSRKANLVILKEIFLNTGCSDIYVKNGYATLCDSVFINEFPFRSQYIIPVIKASRGTESTIIYPYNKNGALISEAELMQETNLYKYLETNKNKLLKRSVENGIRNNWYVYGRSQAVSDTYKNKLSLNTLVREVDDIKIREANKGTGVYSGLYITSKTINNDEIRKALLSNDFITYVTLLGKYKSGGYYTFSSNDVKSFLDYKFAYKGDMVNNDK